MIKDIFDKKMALKQYSLSCTKQNQTGTNAFVHNIFPLVLVLRTTLYGRSSSVCSNYKTDKHEHKFSVSFMLQVNISTTLNSKNPSFHFSGS